MPRAVKTSPAERPKRRYDATGRRAAAQETRRRVLAAARDLFLARGYAVTTMAAIAAAAAVSVVTIYLVEMALSGTDQPVPALERQGVRAILAEPDPRRKVQRFARLVRELQERLGPI